MPVSVANWLSKVVCTPEQSAWLLAFESDVQSVEIAYDLYARNASRLTPKLSRRSLEQTNCRTYYHARSFVGAVRRVGLLLEAVNLSAFPPVVGKTIKNQRKRKAAFFKRYVQPRNVSEHIADEAKSPAKHVLKTVLAVNPSKRTYHPIICIMALHNSELVVPGVGSAPITKTAKETVLSLRREIIASVAATFPARTSELFSVYPIDVSGFDR